MVSHLRKDALFKGFRYTFLYTFTCTFVYRSVANFVTMIHRGEIVEQAVRKSGFPIAELARRMKRSRRHVYNLFENPNISLDVILEVGKVIHHDFSKEFKELRNHHVSDNSEEYVIETDNNVEYWKNKYLLLLEKYNELLERNGQ